MARTRSWIAAERPVDRGSDVLFQPKSELWNRLRFLADDVAAAVARPTPSPGIVFGVFAPWGSGKSSALQIILDLIRESLTEEFTDVAELRADGGTMPVAKLRANLFAGAQQVLSTSTFRANIHEASGQPARLSLAYEILQGFPEDYRDSLLKDLGYQWPEKPGAASPIRAEMFLRDKLGEFADAGPAVEQWILESFLDHQDEFYGGQNGAGPRYSHVHVQLIDDLDRCSEAYTADVLTALSFWSVVPNLYFVVAADELHLQKAAQAATADLREKYDGQALEKFVHFSLRIPALVTSYHKAAEFALQIMPPEDATDSGLLHLRNLLGNVGASGPFGLLAPKLRARTPRQAKRMLNELLQEFSQLVDVEGDSAKRIIAEMEWPDDYENYIAPALIVGENGFGPDAVAPRAEWLRICLEVATEALATHASDVEGAVGRLRELARARGVDLADCSPELLLYLGAEPPLDPPDSVLTQARRHASRALTDTTRIAERAAQNVTAGVETGDVSDLITQADIAAAAGTPEELLEACAEIIKEAAVPGAYGSRDAPAIGNLAIKVEQVNPQVAFRLHVIAQTLNPEHTNIRMNLADFLLDLGGAGQEEVIDANLTWCEQNDPTFKTARRVVLQARLNSLLNRPLTNLDEIIGYAIEGEAYSDVRVHVWGLIRNMDLPDRYDELVRPWFKTEYEAGLHDICALLLGTYFDSLLASRDETAKARGADALRYAIREGFTSTEDETRAINYANLAIYLANIDLDAAAAAMYRLAYELSPRTAAIRSAYARFLLRLEDPQNARAVQQGQELSIPPPTPEEIATAFADVPERFAPDGQWWEEYPPVRLIDPLRL